MTKARRAAQPRANARSRILDAADEVFVRRGIDGARMQDIADRAGVNKALLHYYFRSKSELSRAVWLRIASSFVPGIFEMLASDISLDEKIDQFVSVYHGKLARHPYLLRYVITETGRHPEVASEFYLGERHKTARRMIAKLRGQIDQQVRKKKMAPLSAEQFLVTLASSCLFPFAAQPMLSEVLGLGPEDFDALMERRRTELPAFLKRAFRR